MVGRSGRASFGTASQREMISSRKIPPRCSWAPVGVWVIGGICCPRGMGYWDGHGEYAGRVVAEATRSQLWEDELDECLSPKHNWMGHIPRLE